MTKLAIVIPYYKPSFFRDALLSIKNQTDNRFTLYIGNDNSPDDPDQIIQEIFGDSIAVQYYKFNNNLGALHLTRQWERCINLASEPYIWLFSDDDLMPPDAVERFYNFTDTYPDAELLRFNIDVINDDGQLIIPGVPHPLHETAQAFMIRRLSSQCLSAACEYIFTKDVYLRNNGMVDFPVAWASDDATWITFGQHNGIYTIPGAPVFWRFGSLNISSDIKKRAEKTKASLMFVKFVQQRGCNDKQLLLRWLVSQLNVMQYTAPMKAKFLFSLVITKMFSIFDIIKFAGNLTVKKVFNY